jgi:DNA-binding transcriptional regulator YdaS (Cro superfamily)
MSATIEALNEAVERAGGHSALATICGVGPTAVWNWKARNSVPPEYCALIEANTDVRRWRLRPLDWFRIWPELVGIEGAPEVPSKEAA